MNGIYILLGSNLGDRLDNLLKAERFISKEIGNIIKESKVYKTSAWGIESQPFYLNKAIKIETLLPPSELLNKLLFIEKQLGRERIIKWGNRVIDLDILYYHNVIFKEKKLILPHPYISERRFVLIPMTEIAPNEIHPVFLISQKEMLINCTDDLSVEKV